MGWLWVGLSIGTLLGASLATFMIGYGLHQQEKRYRALGSERPKP
jgi:hypothetical protein